MSDSTMQTRSALPFAASETKVKLCGMRRPEDIEAVNAVRPDYIGFICNDRFWRYIPMEEARKLKRMLDSSIRAVGVFVDDPFEKIAEYLKNGVIDLVQLHGNESEYYIRQLQNVMAFQGTRVPIIKALKIESERDIEAARRNAADYVLLDNGAGTGASFDWTLIRDIERDYFLAGGLGPDNVREAVERFHPFAVDMSSSLETDKVKNPAKIEAAVRAVRESRKTAIQESNSKQ